MPRDGAGTYTLPVNSFNPAVPTTTIASSAWNATATDFSTEFTDSWDRSGKGAALANLAMGGFKFTGLGAPSAGTDSARLTDVPTSFTLTGDVTSAANITTVAKIQGVTVAGTTGGTNSVFSNNATMSTATFTGATVIAGLTSGANPAAGKIGEIITGTTSGVTLTGSSTQNMASILLTPGNWLIIGAIIATGAGGAVFTQLSTGLSVNSGAFSGVFGTSRHDAVPLAIANISWTIPAGAAYLSTAGSQNIFLLTFQAFASGTATGGGTLTALRVS